MNNPFYKLPNMLITSWSAWYSDDADEQRMELFFENLARFVCGKRLLSIADSPQPFYSKQEGI